MTINSIQEANAALLPYVPLVAQLTGKDTTLERIKPLMELLGNPQDRLKVIHIAGTSGKTSTAYYMAAMLAVDNKVGLTVSPHVDSVAERVQVNGRPLNDASFCSELGEFLDIIAQAKQQPSYFELLYAFAIWVFAKQEVDYAVVETGVGGLYDATNVVTRRDKVCVITDIGFDHTHLLGKNLTDITSQKAGIIHDGNAVFTYQQSREIMSVIQQAADEHNAQLHIISAESELTVLNNLHVMPKYQQHNWLIAKQVYDYLCDRDTLKHLTSEELQQTKQLQVPARMDTKQIDGKIIVMDGAHNLQKMTAFVDSFRQLYPDVKPIAMLALKDDKEYQSLIPIIVPLASEIIVTTFNATQDLPIKSMDPEVLAQVFCDGGASNVLAVADQDLAVKYLLKSPSKVCIITGSFYLLSQVRNNEALR